MKELNFSTNSCAASFEVCVTLYHALDMNINFFVRVDFIVFIDRASESWTTLVSKRNPSVTSI